METSYKKIKQLPFFRRPHGAKKIIEIGCGHAPFKGITHAVDKFPGSTEHRAHALHIPSGVVFKEGDLEAIPFEEKFDFLYASHVFEHVNDPQQAIKEINRVAKAGYMETPAPIWEQLCGPEKFDPEDIHKYFVWTKNNQLCVIKKTQETIMDFCDSEYGLLAKTLCETHRSGKTNVERLLASRIKTTKFYFTTPIKLHIFKSFQEATNKGFCAYESLSLLKDHLKLWPITAASKRTRGLHRILSF